MYTLMSGQGNKAIDITTMHTVLFEYLLEEMECSKNAVTSCYSC